MTNMIEATNLQYRWKPHLPLVLDIDHFEVGVGEHVFLKGPSGSGKSTLLGLIGGVLSPLKGQLQVLNCPLHQYTGTQKDQFRADHLGFVFQMFNLLPYLSVVENVTLPCHFSSYRKKHLNDKGVSAEEEAFRLLEQMGLPASHFSKFITELSVGQQQRVAVARALIGAPEMIIADEPTSSLDHDSQEEFLKLLFEECQKNNTTLLFVSHDHSLAPLFERTVDLPQMNQATHAHS